MKHTPRLERAIRKAALLHDGQMRRGEKDIPYVSHLFSVAIILSEHTEDEDVLIAALLHDSLEDTSYSREEVERDFGARVSRIVSEVSEQKLKNGRRLGWKERKGTYINGLRSSSLEGLLVAAADKIHNLENTLEDFLRHGPAIWKNFSAPPKEQIWFYGQVLEVLKERLGGPILERYLVTIKEAERVFKLEAKR